MTLVYQSTRDEKNRVTASQAILQGLATDGGLFTPITYPQVDLDFAKLKDASYQEVAKLVLSAFLDDFSEAELDHCITIAYDSKFDGKQNCHFDSNFWRHRKSGYGRLCGRSRN